MVISIAAVVLSGCTIFGGRPSTVAPAATLYDAGERLLLQDKYEQAREQFSLLAERHPESDLAPVARFLVGETYFRAKDFEKAVPEFESFARPTAEPEVDGEPVQKAPQETPPGQRPRRRHRRAL